jgi:protein-S-isoprenylcysteine O-methyltransferase Ste14
VRESVLRTARLGHDRSLLYRVRVEEAELTRVLGPEYRAYAAATDRLIPGLW